MSSKLLTAALAAALMALVIVVVHPPLDGADYMSAGDFDRYMTLGLMLGVGVSEGYRLRDRLILLVSGCGLSTAAACLMFYIIGTTRLEMITETRAAISAGLCFVGVLIGALLLPLFGRSSGEKSS